MAESETKLYIGGLPQETTKESLDAHFSQYGEITDCVVMVDKATCRSRGFGFVTFADPSSANAAVHGSNFLDGRTVSVKRAVKDAPKQIVQDASGVYNTIKVFVGGLPSSCDYDKLTDYFGQFGEITDAVVMMDSATQRHRGFGYVSYTDPSAVEAVMAKYKDNKIDGKWVEVKRCIPQDKMGAAGGGGSRGKGGGRSGGGGGGGGNGSASSGGHRGGSGGPPSGGAPYGAVPPPGYGGGPPGYGQYYGGYPGYPSYPGYPPPGPYGPPPGYPGYPPPGAYGGYGGGYGMPPPGYGPPPAEYPGRGGDSRQADYPGRQSIQDRPPTSSGYRPY